jgi:hypothetical protein
MRSNFNTVLKNQSIIALAILWIGGIMLFVYLLFIFDKANPVISNLNSDIKKNLHTQTITDSLKTDSLVNSSSNKTDAYVFVNINNKHFLTKFISTLPEKDTIFLTQPSKRQKPSSVVERVKRIFKPKTVKKSSDFSIKRAPKQ